MTSARTFGAERCSPSYRNEQNEIGLSHRLVAVAAQAPDFFMQEIKRIRDQWDRPSCVPQAIFGYLDTQLPFAGSAVDVWRDARRRQGKLEKRVGTRPEYAFESLNLRGCCEYVEGEDRDEAMEPSLEKDDLGDEFASAAHRLPANFGQFLIPSAAKTPETVISALLAGYGVVKSAGVSQRYASYYADDDNDIVVFDADDVGTYGAGHMERVAGYYYSGIELLFVIQGSWGMGAGGLRTPDGLWRKGCYVITETALQASWDVCVLTL